MIYRYLPFTKVQKCFQARMIFASPLLIPVDAIERILKLDGYLMKNEGLLEYDCDKEAFRVRLIEEKPLSFLELIRYRIAKALLP